MPASSRATAGCSAATTRAAARAMPKSSPAPALREIDGRAARARPTRPRKSNYAMHAHGAVFAEVKVDPDLGQIRATRLVGAFAAGRVINPRLVRSQYYGGMIWGVSFALHERAVMDPRSGRRDERQSRRIPRAGERRRPLAARRSWSRSTTRTSTRSASRASARSGSPEPPARSPMRSGMRPACACASFRSPSRSCCNAPGRKAANSAKAEIHRGGAARRGGAAATPKCAPSLVRCTILHPRCA